MSEPLLEIQNVTKSFGHVEALRGADLCVHQNEVVALVGDNGAGKSTMVKVISGVFEPDSGDVLLNGKPVRFSSPLAARAAGIETVYQDLALANDLDPTANLFLGRELLKPGLLGRLGFLDSAEMRRRTTDAFSVLGVRIPGITSPVTGLSGGQRQGVAVSRAVTWASKIVVMDEPTAALGVVQTRKVLDMICRVREAGLSVIVISHDLPEVFEVADRIEVLRLGVRVGSLRTQDTDMEQVIGMMTGAITQEAQKVGND
jgi:simple sugar transport system ATP-binding protein